MARKVLKYTVVEDKSVNRDGGKTFHITELPAREAERWALRALLAMSRNGINIPDSALEGGFASLAVAGLNLIGNMPFDEAEALMDKMMECVQYDPGHPYQPRPLVDSDIEEVSTLVHLRAEVFKLHADFLKAVKP